MRRLETRILAADHAKDLCMYDLNDRDRVLRLERQGMDVTSIKLAGRPSASCTPVPMSSSADGSSQRPIAGLIFMCNDKVRKQCFRYGVFGMPMARKPLLDQVRPGSKLFLFEFEARELWGIYEATTTAGVDIEPDAYRGAEIPFPAQVKFRVYKKCERLREDIFRQAIKKNYYMPNKFKFELTEDQVLKLMRLFSPRETISNGVVDRGLFHVSASPNIKKHFQILEETDFFPNSKNESREKSIVATPADSRFIKHLDHGNLGSVPDNSLSKTEQYFINNGQSDLKSQLIASHIRAAGNLHSDVRMKHYISNSEEANIDHNSVEVSRDDSYMVDRRYNRKYILSVGEGTSDPKRKGLLNSFKDAPVSNVGLLDMRLVPKNSESFNEDEYRLYKLKMKCLNDKAFQRQLLSLDQYSRGENFVQTTLEGDPKSKGEYVEAVKGLHARQFQDSDSLQATVRRDAYINDDRYLYEQRNLPQSGMVYRTDLVYPQGSGQVFIDKLDSYDATPERVSRKKQLVTESLEPCLVQKLAYVPVPSNISHPAVARADVDGNYDGSTHNSTGTRNFSSRFLQEGLITSNLVGCSTNRTLTPTMKNDSALLENYCIDGDNLIQTQDDFFEGIEHLSPNRIENEVQLVRASGKDAKYVRADNSYSYIHSSFLEKTPAQCCNGKMKQKPSVWSRLSRPKHILEKDSLPLQRDCSESPDSRGYFEKKRKFPKFPKCSLSEEGIGLEDGGRANEESFIIDFKRRKRTRETGPSVNPDDGVHPEAILYSEMAGKRNTSLKDDCGNFKGRRKIRRPILPGDSSTGRQSQIDTCIKTTVCKISQTSTSAPEFLKERSNDLRGVGKETL